MELEAIKKSIEEGTIGDSGIIFVAENSFVPIQYITEISRLKNSQISYVNSLTEVLESNSLFGIEDNSIKVLKIDTLESEPSLRDRSYIICKKYSGENGVVIPKLEPWQMIDYITTNSSKDIDKLKLEDIVKACSNDMHAVENEWSKYSIFDEKNQKFILDKLYEAGQIRRTYEGTIFDFTNALLDRNIEALTKFYLDITNYDIEPLGVITILYRQLKNILLVGFNKNPTEENTGLSSKQIYAIKRNLGRYKSDKILEAFRFICNCEKALKEGKVSNNQLLDYVVVNLL